MAGRGRHIWAASLLALALLAAVAPARAQSDAPAVRLDARLGYGDLVREGAPTPLRVIAESDRFFAGTIQINVQGDSGPLVLRRDIEIPGGSRKEYLFLAPRSRVVDVRAVDRRGRLAGQRTPQATALSVPELIGIVGDPPFPTRATIPLVDRDARIVPVTSELELGPAALRSLSHLVVDADVSGRQLSPRQREAILGFALEGGELIVAASSEAALSFLPEAWRGTGGGPVRRTDAGDGKVTVSLVGLNSAAWAQDGPMWARTIRPADMARWRSDNTQNEAWFEALRSSGGFRRTTLGWLLAFVLAYVALAGPLNFFVLARRGRRELAWVTVPALAILFTVGAYVVGRGVRNVPVVQGTGIVVFDAAGERSAFAVGVLSRSGGNEQISLPGEWLAEPFSFTGLGSAPTMELGRDSTVARFRLAVGAVGSVAARRVLLNPTGSAGTLTAASTAFAGEVTNTTPFALRNAGVFIGNSVDRIGELPAGGKSTVTVNDEGPNGVPIDEAFAQQGGFRSEDSASFALLRAAGQYASVGEPGRAYLFGTVDLREVGTRLGVGRMQGTALILIPVQLAVPNGTGATAFGIRRSIVAADGQVQQGSQPLVLDESRDATFRFEIPAGAGVGSLTVRSTNFNGGPPFIKRFVQGGRVQVVPAPGSPEAGNNGGLSLYDFAHRRWQDVSAQDGSVTVSGSDATRYLSPEREVLVRLHFDFPQPVFANQITLETSA